MFDSKFITTAINRSTQNRVDRRLFLRAVGLTGLGAGAATLGGSATAFADEDTERRGQISDFAILNFALNLEYLEAEFYARAVTGFGLPDAITGGLGERGQVVGGSRVRFETPAIRNYAIEIAADEIDHVNFLRRTIGSQKVAEPAINLRDSFKAVGAAAGLGQTFDPFANERNFLLGAFIFEDVGVTAYKGAAPLINNKTYLEAAAGILAVEAYHSGNIRTSLVAMGLEIPSVKISDARDSLDGPDDLDQGVLRNGRTNIVPSDSSGLAFSRSAGQVLNIVYITPEAATQGGFFPEGVNGPINTSEDNA